MRQPWLGAWPTAVALAVALLLIGAGERSELAWVRSEVRLNLRTGPDTDYRILGVVKTGDALNVLKRGDGWTEVRTAEGTEGWIPAGYLKNEAPPLIRVARLESELEALQQELEALTTTASALRTENDRLATRGAEREAELEHLTKENLNLKAGTRWPYLITGASILAGGMLVGTILHRAMARRPGPRIRF